MIGLIISEVILFAVAALLGFGVGWRAYVMLAAERRELEARETEKLRAALTEAQVRRARVS
ncbi:MAG: hypothetical protein IPL62_13590 [Caulobacteraceae bacterium]|nr:hypothetical protein [Caulobacteraceae bacterium]MBP6688575.1 hypothetical protein [Hyphomonadaceae bacterium]